MNRKKVYILTTSRADLDLLFPVISEMNKIQNLKINLIVSGNHYNEKFGNTHEQLKKFSSKIIFKHKFDYKKFKKLHIMFSMSDYIKKLSNLFEKKPCDIFLILGDRYETLASAYVANFFGIPIAHISGGEITIGSQDDSYRHAITKLSRFHFVSHKSYKKRLLQLGEEKKNIFNYGFLGKENVSNTKILSKEKLEKILKIKFKKFNFFVSYHPETIQTHLNVKNFKILISSLLSYKNTSIYITSPNADVGSDKIVDIINDYRKKNFKINYFKSLGKVNYFSLLNYCNLYIGNSSSGISEIPYLKKYSINVGTRQQGRHMPNNVINIPFEKKRIINEINKILLKKKFNKKKIKKTFTSKKIAETISKIKLTNYVPKKFIDLNY